MTFTDIKSAKKNVKLLCFVLLLTAFLCGCKSSVQETMTQEAKMAEKEEEQETAAAVAFPTTIGDLRILIYDGKRVFGLFRVI